VWRKLLVRCLIGLLVTLLPATARAEDRDEQLLAAVRRGDADRIELLLDLGARVDSRDVWGKQPISVASFYGDIAAVELLLQRGADVNAQDNWHRTPLIAATQAGRIWVVDILLHHGAAVDHRSSNGISALIAAAQRGNVAAVQMLLAAGADVDSQDITGRTALMWAASREDAALVALLLDWGAAVNVVDCAGKTVLDQCKERSCSAEIIRILGSRDLFSEVRPKLACGREDVGGQPGDRLYYPVIAGSVFKGGADAAVTIVEYTDLQCPYCKEGAEALDAVLAKYGRHVRLVLKHYPLESHQMALPAAVYFEAVASLDPGKAWQFQQRVFRDQSRLKEGESFLRRLVSELGISLQDVDAAVSKPGVKARIAADIAEANSFGIDGVPAFIINGQLIDGAASREEFDRLIGSALSSSLPDIAGQAGDKLQ